MKTMKLSSIENNLLDAKEARAIVGGDRVCGCACYYRNVGGSAIVDNREANFAGGPGGWTPPTRQVTSNIKLRILKGTLIISV